ncbi:uncharacterized protein LOC119682052 [Teleopsis dalmanni]|uniref:uncharacterized protein LOC119682052 n=1 Tax=Teleopsis dalmanni TaxID=139649 RepID=UPI0018CD76F0|nr:uncharacterized protein LOC119682052 [Teleopsis dalmanni]
MAHIRPLNSELAKVARVELNENENNIQENIIKLREWIVGQTYLKARTDDQFLLAFLRFCKYNLQNAKIRIEYYYTYKSTGMEVLKVRHIDEKLLGMVRDGIFATLPNPIGPGGPRIHYTRMGNIDTSKYSVYDVFRYHTFRSEIEINTDDNWVISGVVEIIDFGKIPFAFLRQYDSGLFKKMSAFLEYGVPTNLKGTHIVNASMEAQIVLTLVRTCMKQKELLHIHSSVQSLQKAIGAEYLPVELGGENGTLDDAVNNFEQLLLSYDNYFNEEISYGVDEKLRNDLVTETKSSGEGSFRKLDVD